MPAISMLSCCCHFCRWRVSSILFSCSSESDSSFLVCSISKCSLISSSFGVIFIKDVRDLSRSIFSCSPP
ncbi:hypothetical protein PUN28_004479 [Cardiocondyla obscurior]|uniref:Secreted protein n=1 Tax=Cardiocondyla obscurior TaxID=286306 RepID=A0AAW2GG17_9HYME